uniref:probable polygalacturonase At3g15720 n=1 Tax=Erigeron canadensis TaxID=72917 RepID=UPI001CB94311|nr:probable polygalacturonase At3g15720 [Erigeron canadensis]
MQYGAKGDGNADDTKAFERAWQGVCNDDGQRSTLTIPLGKTFLVGPVNFQGPCKSPVIHFQIRGMVIAPEDPNSWNGCETGVWLLFSNVNGLIMDGGGMINGRGRAWWTKSYLTYDIKNAFKCAVPPSALHFENCNGLRLSQLKHRDSPRNHIGLSRCNNASLSHLDILAPASSPNTDGIDISISTQIRIQHSVIKTGDDCIALSNGSSQIDITGIDCGPGHGISIGSLGMNGEYSTVEGVYVRKCNFSGTQNGARIKTWQGGSGYARDITFEQINLHKVYNPILIDQYYCPGKHNCPKGSSGVNISDISYKLFQGTSISRTALNFDCSSNVPCSGISLDRINITSAVNTQHTIAYCNNAYGTSSFTEPSATCLSH